MRVLATLSKLLLGASLTTSVLAAPKPIETHLERRFQSLDDDIKADDATWEAFTAACGGGSSRRDLRKRSNNVEMGDSGKMELYPIGLKTSGLLSCVGMVITGNKKDGTPFRILGHVAGSKNTIESQWQKFKGFYEGMGDIDKDSTTGYLSVPDYKKKYEDGATGYYDNHEDRRDLSEELEDELKKRLDELVDGNPRVLRRDIDSAATMEVTGNNAVLVNDQPV